jgi:hypothetical protein
MDLFPDTGSELGALFFPSMLYNLFQTFPTI